MLSKMFRIMSQMYNWEDFTKTCFKKGKFPKWVFFRRDKQRLNACYRMSSLKYKYGRS